MERRSELKKICLENGINNPIIGEEHYDPTTFDYSRVPLTFGHKINSLCYADPDIYYKYKNNTRQVMD